MFNKSDITRDACQLFGAQARKGYDWWMSPCSARFQANRRSLPI